MASTGAGIAGAGSLVGAFAGYEAAQENAAAMRRNAKIARAAAAFELQRGESRAWKIRMAASRRTGAQVAAYAHAGIDPTSGTPLATVGQTARVAELDAQTERSNAWRQAWGLNAQATQFEADAAAKERQSYFSLIGGGLSFAGGMF